MDGARTPGRASAALGSVRAPSKRDAAGKWAIWRSKPGWSEGVSSDANAGRPSLSTIGGINTGPGGVLPLGACLSNAPWSLADVRSCPTPGPREPASASNDAGEDRAFSDEALSYIDALYGTALRLTRRPQDAEDLVQDTYLKAFRASKQFQRGTNLKAWLFTILHNTFRNMRRHDGRNPVDVNSETVEQAADVARRRADARAAVDAGDARQPICRRPSTDCRTRSARRSGCATSRSSRTPTSRGSSTCRLAP